MPSPRAELATARVVSVATIVLAVGLLLVSTLVLWDDFQERRDQRAMIDAGSMTALQDAQADLDIDVTRSLEGVAASGAELAERLSNSADRAPVALKAAVIEQRLSRTLPSLDRVIFQDTVNQVVGVDRFGSPTLSPENLGFDINAVRDRSEAFSDDQGGIFISDGFAAYFPVGEAGEQGWAVLILRSNTLAVGSKFERFADPGTVEPSITNDGEQSTMTAAIPFLETRSPSTDLPDAS